MWGRSVINVTGQAWKLWVGVLALLVGSFAPFSASTGLSWTGGTVLACLGYAYSLAAIRCPGCGRRWVWDATLDATLYKPIFTQSVCPHCKHEFHD